MDWRNPCEAFRDKFLSFKNVRGYKLCALRFRYIPFAVDKRPEYEAIIRSVWRTEIPEDQIQQFIYAYRDMGVKKGIQPWITKYLNAKLSLCINVSIWKGWLPLFHFGLSIRYSKENYFQFGFGFGAEGKITDTNLYERATICGKLRFGNFKHEYTDGGNFDVYDHYEGVI
jgi:hypothetical protein